MAYIEINGKSSLDIRGLLIQSLPPITKPKIRTSVEEIDGVDGDIVTVLGYSAYDKTAKIGLYGRYDIDDVASFFASEGHITFSNEPDKYYRFAQYGGIDFERLVRFRKADVAFHVQPFKYPVTDGTISADTTKSSITVTNLGNVVARPTIELAGSGTVHVSLNGTRILTVMLYGDMIIDSESMEAYNSSGLLNRRVSGDYSKLALKAGSNVISWDGGTLNSVKISNYTRWV